jgi:uncharacterized protein (TIGR03067 family)
VNALLVGVALAVGAPNLKDPPKADPPLLGDWQLVEWVQRGRAMAFGQGSGVEFLPEGKRAWRDGPGQTDERQYKLYPGTKPAAIDLIRTDVGPQPQVYPCVFKVDGDTLVIAIGDIGGERPKTFDAAAVNMLMTFKRVKKKD